MARSPKRITRRDLRRPDQFVTATGRLLDFVGEHRSAFVASLAAIVLALLLLWGWDLFRSRQDHLAAQEYSRALALYHDRKYADALKALAELSAYRFSTYSRLGLLYQANAYNALNQPDKAMAALQELLRKEKQDVFLRQSALLTMAYIQEKTGRCQEAAASYAEAEKLPGPRKEEALRGTARCSEQAGDLKQALSAYRQLLAGFPASEGSAEISLRIGELEGKIAEAGKK